MPFKSFRKTKKQESIICDCCMKGYDAPNEVGLCQCYCSQCYQEMAICRYNCETYKRWRRELENQWK